MISNPKHGWCDIKIGKFEGAGSYLTTVPLDMVNAFIHYYEDGAGACFIDEEGTDFTLVLSDGNAYIIINREKQELYNVTVPIDTLADELQEDIMKCPKEWVREFILSLNEEVLNHEQQNGDEKQLADYVLKQMEKQKTLYLLKQVETLKNIREKQKYLSERQNLYSQNEIMPADEKELCGYYNFTKLISKRNGKKWRKCPVGKVPKNKHSKNP